MKPSEKIYKELVHYWNDFEINYEKYLEYNNQTAARRARVALIELRKRISPLRLVTLEESKRGKKNVTT